MAPRTGVDARAYMVPGGWRLLRQPDPPNQGGETRVGVGGDYCDSPTRRTKAVKRGSERMGSKTDQYLSVVMKEDFSS